MFNILKLCIMKLQIKIFALFRLEEQINYLISPLKQYFNAWVPFMKGDMSIHKNNKKWMLGFIF